MCILTMMMTPDQIATWLKITPQTLIKLSDAGTGPPYVRIGRTPRFIEEELLDWLGYPPDATLPELIEIDAIALHFSKSEEWVRMRIRSGELKAIRIGGQWRVTKDEFERWKATVIKR